MPQTPQNEKRFPDPSFRHSVDYMAVVTTERFKATVAPFNENLRSAEKDCVFAMFGGGARTRGVTAISTLSPKRDGKGGR